MQRRLKRSRDGVRTRYCAVDAQPHGVQECGAGAGEGKDRIGDTADCGPVLREGSTQRPGEVVTFMALGLVIFVSGVFDQTRKSLTSSNDLKKLSVEELMGVEVTTVSRRESTVGESPAAVFVITPEDIRRSGATTFPELFRMVPGMDVARIDNNKWAISARGFNDRFNGKLLVQVDGRTVYNPLSSGVYWDAVDYPLEDIERIEVIRGPGASVWGANAVNGIINIITKAAKDTQGGIFSGGGGTEERGFGAFRYGGTIGSDLYYRVYGKGFSRDRQFLRVGNPNDRWWGASGGLRLDWQVGERDSVTFQGDFLGPSTSDGGFGVSFPPSPHRRPQLFSAFVQDQLTLVEDKLSLTFGSKLEHNDHTGFEVQPTGRLLWTPTKRQSVWAAVSRAVRTPTLSEDGIGTRQLPSFPAALGGAPLFARLAGSPAFKSEELLAYELGYRAQATDRRSVDLALLYNAYDN